MKDPLNKAMKWKEDESRFLCAPDWKERSPNFEFCGSSLVGALDWCGSYYMSLEMCLACADQATVDTIHTHLSETSHWKDQIAPLAKILSCTFG